MAIGLASELGDGFTIRQEYLDSSARDEEYYHSIFKQLKEQFIAPPAAVVAEGPLAAGFISKYREELFPGAPTILTGISRSSPHVGGCTDCPTLPLDVAARDTLDLIFTLRPDTRLVVGITDGTRPGRRLKAALEQAMRNHPAKTQLIFPGHEPGDDSGLDMRDLQSVLAGIPANGVAVFLRFKEDRHGQAVSHEQLVRLFEERIVSPVFVFTDSFLGSGVVGGVLVTGEDVGRSTAELIQRILSGEPAREMLPEPVSAHLVLDGTALTRFGLKPPQDATVVNALESPSHFDEIASTPAIGLTVGLLAFAVVFFLLRRYKQ